MAITMESDQVNRFLAEAQTKTTGGEHITVVLGNEAADLDSMQASILYAYFLNATAAVTAVPVINIPRQDFKLRTEAVYLITQAGIDPEHLVFADEIDLQSLQAQRKLSVVLVDHNRLAAPQEPLSDAVTGIIDHHRDEELFPAASPRIIEPVGSVATLIAERMLAEKKDLVSDGVALLLLGTILLDTVNLDPEAQRATEKDINTVETLLSITGVDRKQLFDDLQREKFNVSALDTPDLLRKDYKEWKLGSVTLGIASVLLPITDWVAKDSSLPASMGAYAKERSLDVLISMNAYTAPAFTRELAVYCENEELRNRLLSFLMESELQLKEITASGSEAASYYHQGHLGYSRKKLQPLLSDFFS
jgi:exopolyphosphatase